MSENLRRLLEMMTTRPELSENDGIVVAVSGDHTTQFANNVEAQFFVACAREVPALLAELDLRRDSDPDAELNAVRLEAATYYETIGELTQKLETTEEALRLETALRTKAQVRARKLAQALVVVRDAVGNKST
jgi:hypothetical protein